MTTARTDRNTPTGLDAFLASCGLAFSKPEDERAFFERYVQDAARITQIFLAIGAISFLTYYEQDMLIDINNQPLATSIRLLYSTPIMLLSSFLIFFKCFRKKIEFVVIFNSFGVLSGQLLIFSVLDKGYNYTIAGFSIIFLALSIAFVIRVKYLFVIAMMALIAVVGGHIYANNADPGWLLVNTIGISTALLLGMVSAVIRERSARVQFMASRALDASRARAEALLGSMLPSQVVERIQAGETDIADSLDEVSVVFADIAGFTSLSRRLSPTDLIRLLDTLFSEFDSAAARFGMEKITTIGDAYMAVGGMDGKSTARELAARAAQLAIAIRAAVAELIAKSDYPIDVRIGVHIGPVVAGVVGDRRPTFDCWGDTIRLATGLEGHAQVGGILISSVVAAALSNEAELGSPEKLQIKDIAGSVTAYTLEAMRA
jgi:class 3 adenylate cyclase